MGRMLYRGFLLEVEDTDIFVLEHGQTIYHSQSGDDALSFVDDVIKLRRRGRFVDDGHSN